MAETNITTGQYVRLSMPAASVLSRITAWIIDGALMLFYTIIMASMVSIMMIRASQTIKTIVIIMFIALPIYFYPFLCEKCWKGKTLGKHVMNIHVVNLDGSRPSTGQLLIRWLLFLVDGLLLGPSIGILSIIFTRNSQRLGDLAAGTVVVRTKDYAKMHIRLQDFLFNNPNYRPFYTEAANLSWRQAETIARVLHEPMDINHRRQLIPQLAQQVQQTLNITPVMPPEQFLQTIVNDYYYYDVR
ncbi:MAG: RDD family protein [Prevotella sp.]|nr:RDD family protein [Prevotella sp.]